MQGKLISLLRLNFHPPIFLHHRLIRTLMNLNVLKAAVIALAFSPVLGYGQWNMLGMPIAGISESDKLGSLNSVAVDSEGNTIVSKH